MQTNLKIFFVLSLISILILAFISQHIEPQKLNIADITEKNLNQNIRVEAKIISLKNFENQSFQILNLKDETGIITATANSRNPFKLDLSKNYTILGKISEYNNTLQISIDKIEILK